MTTSPPEVDRFQLLELYQESLSPFLGSSLFFGLHLKAVFPFVVAKYMHAHSSRLTVSCSATPADNENLFADTSCKGSWADPQRPGSGTCPTSGSRRMERADWPGLG